MIARDDVVGQPTDRGIVLPVPIKPAGQISIRAVLPGGRRLAWLMPLCISPNSVQILPPQP